MNRHLTRGVDDYDQFETLPVYEPASRRRRARRGRNHRRRVCLVAQSQLLVRRKRGRP